MRQLFILSKFLFEIGIMYITLILYPQIKLMNCIKFFSNLISSSLLIIFLNSCSKSGETVVTPSPVPPIVTILVPTAPSLLKASNLSTSAISLSWVDNATNEDGFKIERKIGSANFSLIATLAANKIFYKDSLLTPNTTYTYRVYSYNSAGKSTTYSNLDSAITNFTSITIGTQKWMDNNLEITSYLNGDSIPQVTDSATWANLTTGAWCYYLNDSTNYAKYGKLYNWYAVNDSRGLAPQGWHIPSDAEWTTLETYLGGQLVAGGKMKESGTLHWLTSNNGGTNNSGFSGLPGGFRYDNGVFDGINIYGSWWSSTVLDISSSYSCSLGYTSVVLGRNIMNKKNGYSIRCIKD